MYSVPLSVCLSVCLSQDGILSQWLNGWSWFSAFTLPFIYHPLSCNLIEVSTSLCVSGSIRSQCYYIILPWHVDHHKYFRVSSTITAQCITLCVCPPVFTPRRLWCAVSHCSSAAAETGRCLYCCLGCCNGGFSTCQFSAKEERPRSHIYQCTHRVFPDVIDSHPRCTRWQLLWVSAQDLAADWKNTRFVCVFAHLVTLYTLCYCRFKSDTSDNITYSTHNEEDVHNKKNIKTIFLTMYPLLSFYVFLHYFYAFSKGFCFLSVSPPHSFTYPFVCSSGQILFPLVIS